MDAESIVVDYLNASELGVDAYYEVPSLRPDAFVTVERTGGERSDLILDTPMFDVECWALTRQDAAVLASVVEDALLDMPDALANCFHVSITSTYKDYDLDSGTPRYHIVCEITFAQ